jgi:hypothetical protein
MRRCLPHTPVNVLCDEHVGVELNARADPNHHRSKLVKVERNMKFVLDALAECGVT